MSSLIQVALNEQFMVATLAPTAKHASIPTPASADPSIQTFINTDTTSLHPHHPKPPKHGTDVITDAGEAKRANRVLAVLMRRLGSSKTFGENMIFMLNRAGEFGLLDTDSAHRKQTTRFRRRYTDLWLDAFIPAVTSQKTHPKISACSCSSSRSCTCFSPQAVLKNTSTPTTSRSSLMCSYVNSLICQKSQKRYVGGIDLSTWGRRFIRVVVLMLITS